MKLNVFAFGLASGLVWGIGLFMMTWWIILLDVPNAGLEFIASFYRGYSVSPIGSVIGLAWGLTDGLIGGALFAWIYNRFLGEKTCCKKKPE